ncbi:YdcF family protein [Ancylobacter sp. TS-1]|uniref:YdcF family protein n=1 Tax=Ancylobacter sp. TS-1 TaxID=1850374 RepID=UPI001FEF87BB|nr:YdcF family protein [Ancylobacter sp. TS-1]
MTDPGGLFFVASKLVWMVAVPSTFLALLAACGLLLALRWRRVGGCLAVLGVGGLLLVGLGPFGRVLLLALEDRFPAYVDDGGRVDGVIVLGGAELPAITAARGQPSFQESAERILAMGELGRRYPQARLVFAGGSSSLGTQPMQEAEVVRRALPQIGLDEGRVAFERTSRNTAENARLARALIQPKPGERWLLVTSAFHMPRAVGCFEAAGFPVIAYPVDFRTTGEAGWLRPFDSVAQGLGFFDLALREWVGLAAYYLTRWIASPFPAPPPN